ncbi:hypothetical protein QTN47_05780 [Danxiaibacter flavus]|uniref:Uncharacterized protein n=1 Tax=Danxiaibacter flavus TaxID=3049108 RepID=A0ABV3ZAU9_9BACT|nr:hypothetical protein QNM32_05780 [Chitinophagaceae bacterium DXS]
MKELKVWVIKNAGAVPGNIIIAKASTVLANVMSIVAAIKKSS